MFNQGLSLDQAPPISVPFRFFLTAPIFGILLGILFFFSPFETVSNQYSHEAIGAVHLFTLGILSMIIFGAMQQMMPVLAGAVIQKPRLFANIVHTSLTLGTLFLSAYFIFSIKIALHIGVLLLAVAFLTFSYYSIKLLFKVEFLTSTVKAMRLFAVCTFITLILGLYIASSHMSSNISDNHYVFVNAHMLFGLFGFALLLIMGVAFQVIPMFYVALDFPKPFQNKAPLIVFILLVLSFIFMYMNFDIFILKTAFTVVFLLFAYLGLKSLNNRKRPVFDVTLWYWKLSLGMLMISVLIFLASAMESNYVLAILFAFGFLYSLLQGMVYKIIPFLAWFHLTSKGYFTVPTLREFINEKYIKYNFYLHVLSVALFVLSYYINSLVYLAAIAFIGSNILFLINCITAVKKYKNIAKTDPMDMTAFK